VLGAVEQRLGVLRAALNRRREEEAQVDHLADLLRRLAVGQPVGLPPLQALADALLAEARDGLPLRFLTAPPHDSARFAAAHALTVAQVIARLLLTDAAWQNERQTAVMAALVHDVGMTRVPVEILGKRGSLDDDERRLVERHTVFGGEM